MTEIIIVGYSPDDIDYLNTTIARKANQLLYTEDEKTKYMKRVKIVINVMEA
jgi:hypothetical protein